MKTKKETFLNDEVANIIFTDESLRDYVIAIISKVLDLDEEVLQKNLVLLSDRINNNTEIINSEVDSVYETDDDYINIEINLNNGVNLQRKNRRYLCHLYLKNMYKKTEEEKEEEKKKEEKKEEKEKEKFRNIKQININYFDYFKKNDFIYRSTLKVDKYNIKRDNYFVIYDINMEFLSKWDYNKIKEEAGSLEWLLYILVCENKNIREKLYKNSKIMKKVNDKINDLLENFDNLLYYDKEEIRKADSYDAGLEEGKSIGLQEGIEKGLQEGIEKGLQEGIEKGLQEGKKTGAIEIAKNLILLNMKVEDIAKATSLTIEEIEALKE